MKNLTLIILLALFANTITGQQTNSEKIIDGAGKVLEILNLFKKDKKKTATPTSKDTNTLSIPQTTNDHSDTEIIMPVACKCYVNFTNSTENKISITVYLENPAENNIAKKLTIITLAKDAVKKVKIEKDKTYYYVASNNTGDPVIGGYQTYTGDLEAEKCDEVIQEEIK